MAETIKGNQTMERIQTIGLFHTPESMEELQTWIDNARDPAVTTAAFMMYNFIADLHNKMIDEMESDNG